MTYVGSSWVEIERWSDATGYGNNAEWRVRAYSTQDISANTSKIYFQLQKSVSSNTAWSYDSKSFRISGTGAGGDGHNATQTWTYGTVSDTSWVNVGGDTSDMYWGGVKHRDDGTLSLTATASGDRVMGGTFSTNISIELPTIARASVPTASPNPATVGANGVTVTINTNRKSSSFTHTVSLTCGSWSWSSSARGVGASVAVAIPYSVIAQFSATSKTATCTVSCTTFNGTTNIGTKTATFTLQTDSSVDHPNIGTIAVEDTNERTSSIVGAETFIYGISTLTATIPLTVSGSYTQLASATVTCGTRAQTYSLSGTSQTLTFTFDKVNAPSLSVTVKDKRGNSVSKTKSYTLMAYQPETVTGTVGRVTATGSTAVGQVSGVAYGGDYGQASNELTITYRYKEHDATTWTDSTYSATLSLNEGQQTYTHAITLLEEYDYQKQYDIQFVVNDLFNTATYTAQLMQGLPILSWDETEVDVWGDLHIHNRDNPYVWQDVMAGFDAVLAHNGQKNLLANTGTTVTRNGITYTNNVDGTWTVNGTATADSYGVIADGYERLSFDYPVTLSGCPEGGSVDTYWLQFYLYDGTNTARDYGDGVTVTPSGTGSRNVAIYIHVGTTVNNLVFKPMIRDARIASDEYVRGGQILTINRYTSGSISVPANNTANTVVNFSLPKGYKVLAILRTWTNGNILTNYSTTESHSSTTSARVYLRNPTSSAISVTVTVEVLCMREDFFI